MTERISFGSKRRIIHPSARACVRACVRSLVVPSVRPFVFFQLIVLSECCCGHPVTLSTPIWFAVFGSGLEVVPSWPNVLLIVSFYVPNY